MAPKITTSKTLVDNPLSPSRDLGVRKVLNPVAGTSEPILPTFKSCASRELTSVKVLTEPDGIKSDASPPDEQKKISLTEETLPRDDRLPVGQPKAFQVHKEGTQRQSGSTASRLPASTEAATIRTIQNPSATVRPGSSIPAQLLNPSSAQNQNHQGEANLEAWELHMTATDDEANKSVNWSYQVKVLPVNSEHIRAYLRSLGPDNSVLPSLRKLDTHRRRHLFDQVNLCNGKLLAMEELRATEISTRLGVVKVPSISLIVSVPRENPKVRTNALALPKARQPPHVVPGIRPAADLVQNVQSMMPQGGNGGTQAEGFEMAKMQTEMDRLNQTINVANRHLANAVIPRYQRPPPAPPGFRGLNRPAGSPGVNRPEMIGGPWDPLTELTELARLMNRQPPMPTTPNQHMMESQLRIALERGWRKALVKTKGDLGSLVIRPKL